MKIDSELIKKVAKNAKLELTEKELKDFEKQFKEKMSFDEAVAMLLKGIEKGIGEKEKIDINRLDFAFVEKGGLFERLSRQRLKSFLGKKD